jgi:eukaryotic-like serine/threonine-protein kinase
LPAVRAGIALQGGKADKAIEVLTMAGRYEMAQTAENVNFVLYPIHLRGEACLAAKQDTAAGTEFQKILAHPELVQNELIGAPAQLELGRTYGMSHETEKAKTAYQDFFALWKDAGSGLPILKQARMEYAKLR